jgi:O-antigen biosynthesis protein
MPDKRRTSAVTLSVIIVNYNVREFLHHALVSLRKASEGIRTECIVVDNASDDDSVEMLRRRFPSVRVIANKTNVGFARANNQAIRIARGEFLLLINPDTVVQEDTLRTLLAFMKTHPETGLAGCRVLNPDGTLQLACRRSIPTPWVAFTKISGLSTLFPRTRLFGRYNLTYLPEHETYAVDAVSGSFMLARRSVVGEVGGLDEQFFMYGEDLDWCYRITKAGWTISYVHTTSIIHYKGESTRRSSVDEIRMFYTAMHLFVRKHFRYSGISILGLRLSIALVSFGAWLRSALRPLRDATIDVVAVLLSLIASEYVRRGTIFAYPSYAMPAVIVIPAFMVVAMLSSLGVYTSRRLSVTRAMSGVVTVFVVIAAMTAFVKTYAFSRMILATAGLLSAVLIPGWRLVFRRFARTGAPRLASAFGRRTLIVGATVEAQALLRKLRRRVGSGYEVVGFIAVTHREVGQQLDGAEVLGTLENIAKVIQDHRVSDLIVAPQALSYGQILSLIGVTRRMVSVHLVAGPMEVLVGKASVDHLDDLPLVEITYNLARPGNRFWKRTFDLTLGMLLFIVVSPIFEVRRILTGGPVPGFVQGLGLVMKGSWSFVGPRPEDEVSGERTAAVIGKPGLTGLVQLQDPRNLPPDEAERYNLYYARNQSVRLDLEILLKTWLQRPRGR